MQEQGPNQWTRDTNWRQGHVLPPEAVAHFNLANGVALDSTCVVVITHDCDLANDNLVVEPAVEIVVGRTVAAPDGNFAWAKAPRTLHYEIQRGGVLGYIELVATSKHQILKSELARFEPDPSFHLSSPFLTILRNWLGSRYNRAAFPDAFVSRMRTTKADAKLAKVMQDFGANISFIYFDLDNGECIERVEEDPYHLSIVLVFNPGDDPETAADIADEAADTVEKAVRGRLPEGSSIVLESCFAISEEDIPVSKVRVLTQWRLEHMTLKAEDEQLGPPET